ncbi:MAG: hypothetical protein CM15mP32_5630 [Flavobacteriaceae bacterium]|nr:MAG: hypothetical protein CM15mP32_5630 [Flavobacteriaceae bacterium]
MNMKNSQYYGYFMARTMEYWRFPFYFAQIAPFNYGKNNSAF